MGEVEMQRRVGIVLFDGSEVLDVFGPVELFGQLPDRYRLAWVAPEPGPVRSAQGVEVMATESLDEAVPADIVLVPGVHGDAQAGRGSRIPRAARILVLGCVDGHLGVHRIRGAGRRRPAGGLPGDVEQEGLRVGIRSWPGRHMAPEGALGA